MNTSPEKIKKLASDLFEQIVGFRRHIHQHPELSFAEFETAAFISGVLKKNNISHQTGIAGTGIVAVIEGKNSSSACFALRADIDALPILEKNEVPYRSVNPGIMHACGHDVHTASLLGAALILNELRNEFSGTVKLIFQPGEEKLPGGASLLIKEGVLKNPSPSGIIAQHVFPSLEAGKVGFRGGMYMASTDEIFITVKGKGGHAAMVKEYNNPIYIASQMLLQLEKEFMQENSELIKNTISGIPTVLAFGKFTADGATNVIPDEVKIEGTFRTMNEEWRKKAHGMMKKMAEEKCTELGGFCDFRIESGYPCLVNNPELTAFGRSCAEEYLGKENVVELEQRMTAEDFAFYSQLVPSCFYRLGTGNKSKGINSGVHTSTFDIDENALKTGAGLLAWMMIKKLQA